MEKDDVTPNLLTHRTLPMPFIKACSKVRCTSGLPAACKRLATSVETFNWSEMHKNVFSSFKMGSSKEKNIIILAHQRTLPRKTRSKTAQLGSPAVLMAAIRTFCPENLNPKSESTVGANNQKHHPTNKDLSPSTRKCLTSLIFQPSMESSWRSPSEFSSTNHRFLALGQNHWLQLKMKKCLLQLGVLAWTRLNNPTSNCESCKKASKLGNTWSVANFREISHHFTSCHMWFLDH